MPVGTRDAGLPIRILLAEDHAVVRDGLVAIISQEPDLQVVADVGDGKEAVEQWRRCRPDVTLMDIRMPELNGVAAISEIRAIEPAARIIILTTYDGDEDIYRGIRAGASSYLLKDVSRHELFECIRQVHAGKAFFPTAVAARIVRLTDRSRSDSLTS
jgi:DNA-binding NarL/FixJ family response regulator